MTTDVLGYLNTKNLNIRRAPGNEVHITCMFCGETEGKRGRLYVNVDPDADIPGLWMCHLCGAKGSLATIKRHFGDATEKQEREDDGYQRRAMLAEAARYYHEALEENLEVIDWLRTTRGLSIETIMKYQLGYAHGGLLRHLRAREFKIADMLATGLVQEDRATHKVRDFLTNHVTIPYTVAGNVVMIRGRDLAGGERKYVTPAGQKTRMFNTDAIWEAGQERGPGEERGLDEIVVCEGEFDCMILAQQGVAAVAIPGANTWQESWDSYFKDLKRVYIVFDNDDAGIRGAEKVAKRISRARVVAMPEHAVGEAKVDVTEFFVGQRNTIEDFKALLAHAGGGMLVSPLDALAEHRELQGQVGLRFGIPKLDVLLEPGLLRSQLMVFIAKSGCGKTLLLLNLFQRLCLVQPEAKILFFSLEQTRGDWWERARRIYRFFHVGASDEDALRFWQDRIRLVDRNRITTEHFLTCVQDFTDEMGAKPDLVAIDYLGYWAQSFKGDRYERTSDAVMELKALAKDQRLAIMTPHQVSRMNMLGAEPMGDGGRDSGVVAETADFLIPLWRPDQMEGRTMPDRSGEFKLKVAKSRHGGDGHVEHMYLAPLSLAIVPGHEQNETMWARRELHYQTFFREHWEQALVRHEAGTPLDAVFAEADRRLWQKRQGKLRVVS